MNWLAGKDAGWYAGWFGIDDDPTVFSGFGPSGVATLVGVETGFKVTLTWATDVRLHRDGTEQRASTLDRPKQHYDGSVILVSTGPRLTRARMARYAAEGAEFLLGLPHEGLTLLANASGATVTVNATLLAACDWANIGQRVVVVNADSSSSSDAVIQSVAGGSIVLDVAPGSVGNAGGMVMPAMAVFLEPQQDFDRYTTLVEAWKIQARAALFDFCPPRAALDLQATTSDVALAGAFLTSRRPGLFGEYAINFANTGAASLTELGLSTTINFQNGVTTLADVATLLASSDNLILTGSYNPAAVLHTADAFTASLAGTQASGNMGTGASLTMYAGLPVWDRGIKNPDTISDAVNAMTEILDLGGVPYAIGTATYPAWGRTVAIESGTWLDWQWVKLFLSTVRGAQGVWWLPSWRSDLTWVATGVPSGGVTAITIDTADDVMAWYPSQRNRLMVQQADGTITYCQIVGTPVDNGDGTTTISVNATLTGTAVTMLSWLEPCRFEQDAFEVTFTAGSFAMSVIARAHATNDPDIAEGT